jgi:hypothetical protein
MSGNLGGALVVSVMGWLNDAQGDFSGALLLLAVLAAVAAGIATALPEPLSGRAAPAVG